MRRRGDQMVGRHCQRTRLGGLDATFDLLALATRHPKRLPLAAMPLAMLTANDLARWRKGLPKELRPATVNRRP